MNSPESILFHYLDLEQGDKDDIKATTLHNVKPADIINAMLYYADQQNADLKAEIERLKGEKWVSVEDKVPNEFQSVAFVVVSHNESYNNRVLGGTYLGIKGGIHEFAVPGIGFEAEFWQPLPSPPNIFKSTK